MMNLKNILGQEEKETKNKVTEETTVKENEKEEVVTFIEPVIKTNSFRWNSFYLNEEFRDAILLQDFMNSENGEKVKANVLTFMEKNFSCPVMGKYEKDSFVTCMEEDFNRFHIMLLGLVNNPDQEVTKSDFWKVVTLYAVLLGGEILPESELTQKIGVSLNSKNRPNIPRDTENGVIFNKILIILTDFFQSVENGLFEKMEEKEKFIAEISLYGMMINILENKSLVDLVTNATEENKMKHFSNLSTKDGKISSRKIEGFENKDIVEQKQQSSANNNVEIDLSNISTSNKRKEVISEFESKNNDSEELPNLERI